MVPIDVQRIRPVRRAMNQVVRRVAPLLLVLAFLVPNVRPADGMAFQRASALVGGCVVGNAYSDVQNHPDDVYRWPKTKLRYKRMPSFKSAFGNPAFARQVALAFQTWDEANVRPRGAAEAYWAGFSSVEGAYDFRSILLHEIGHALGLAHSDDAYDPSPAKNRSYRRDAAGTLVQAPADPNSVMSTIHVSFDHDLFNQILTWDDLDALAYSHPGVDLSFVETQVPWQADILLRAKDFTLDHDLDDKCGDEVDDLTLAYTLITDSEPVDPIEPTLGRTIKRAEIWFNTNTSALNAPIGVRTRKALWDVQLAAPPGGSPTPLPIRAVQVQTRRANNPFPMAHYDNQDLPLSSPQPFQWVHTFRNDPVILDRLLHTWSDSLNGAIAWQEPIRIGIQLDVDSWFAEFLRVVHGAYASDEVPVPSPPLSPIDVQETVILSEIPLEAGRAMAGRLAAMRLVPDHVGAEPATAGMVLTNPTFAQQQLRLSRLAIADATADGTIEPAMLALEDLAPERLADRFDLHEFPVSNIEALQELDAGEAFYVFVSGDATSLPPGFQGQYAFLADYLGEAIAESLRDRALIVVAVGQSDLATITTATVLGVSPIVGTNPPLLSPVYLPSVTRD